MTTSGILNYTADIMCEKTLSNSWAQVPTIIAKFILKYIILFLQDSFFFVRCVIFFFYLV